MGVGVWVYNYLVYDNETFTRCQAPWGDAKSAKKLDNSSGL